MARDPALAQRLLQAVDEAFAGHTLCDGIPAPDYGCRAETSHGLDARFRLASLKSVTGVMTLFEAERCGVAAIV